MGKSKLRSISIKGKPNFSDLFDALPSYVMLVDDCHNILSANRAVQTHLGVEPEAIIGKYCPKVIHGLDEPFSGCPLEEAAEKGQAIEREVFDEKTQRWLLSAVYPTKATTSQGTRVFLHTVTDITDRKRAEEQLKESREKIRRLSAHLESLGEEERKKIARDLHDDTGQLLAGMTAHLEAAIGMLPAKEQKIKSILKNVESLSVNVIEQLQKVTYELRPLVLDDLGLVSAVRWLIDNNLKTAGIKVTFKTGGKVKRVDRQVETTIFRVIQEAVSNIVRHAQATIVEIDIRFMKTRIRVKIKDNGKGFNLEEALSSNEGLRGLGLLGMKERIELIKGTFNLVSNPDNGGTEITFEIFLPSEVPEKYSTDYLD
ncbi:MAG: ATP-binding protein [Chloroflexota bacterium]